MNPGTIDVDGFRFQFVASLEVDRSMDGRPKEFFPQNLYRNDNGLRLNKYGKGPFCRFQIPNIIKGGVYIIYLNGKPVYVGECQDLGSRFNVGYGIISPRNCFEGGRSTNCRINSSVLNAIKQGLKVDLFFLETNDRFRIERELINKLSPEWNRSGGKMPISMEQFEGTDKNNQVPGKDKKIGPKPDFVEIWNRIRDHVGETFTQIRGQNFTYVFQGSHINPSTTEVNLPRAHFEEAYGLVPLKNTSPVQHLWGPSYIFAILMDPCIRESNW
jgi:hypothetical protein